jgi:hypothetical protein
MTQTTRARPATGAPALLPHPANARTTLAGFLGAPGGMCANDNPPPPAGWANGSNAR